MDGANEAGAHAAHRRFVFAFAMLDIDRVVPLNEANVDEYLFHRTQFVYQGRECDEMLD